jgi:hypothetical protein
MEFIFERKPEYILNELEIGLERDMVNPKGLDNFSDIFEGIGRHKTVIESDGQDPEIITVSEKVKGERTVFPAAVGGQNIVRRRVFRSPVLFEKGLKPILVFLPLTLQILPAFELPAVDAEPRLINPGGRNRGRKSAGFTGYWVT